MADTAVTVTGQLALISAALFTGAAFYINWAEQPARLRLDEAPLLAQWKPSYHRGFSMQASLAIIGFILASMTWMHGAHWLWLLGGLVLASNWPYTLLVILPVNKRLDAMNAEAASGEARSLIESWGRLHGVRTALGAAATLFMLIASFQY